MPQQRRRAAGPTACGSSRCVGYRPPVHSTDAGAPTASLPGLTACSLCAGETLGDHDPSPDGQLGRLRALADAGLARLSLVECLDECERGDVVVVRPSREGRTCGGRPVWFEQLAGEERSAGLAAWLGDGGPGLAPLPGALEPVVIVRRADDTVATDDDEATDDLVDREPLSRP